jgi:hypothetical protein
MKYVTPEERRKKGGLVQATFLLESRHTTDGRTMATATPPSRVRLTPYCERPRLFGHNKTIIRF